MMALLWCSGLQAQEIGDRVRVRMEEQEDWLDGSLSDFDAEGTLVLRGSIYEREYRVADIQQGDWYQDRPLAQDLLIGGLVSVAYELVFPCDSNIEQIGQHHCFSLDRGSQFALQAVAGVAFGALFHLIVPGGRWNRWIEDGFVIR